MANRLGVSFSLVLATVDRVQELEVFFGSLVAQRYPSSIEVVLVDQNVDGRLNALVDKYKGCFSIRHVHSARGLSRARNVGLQFVTGDIVAFPDDDCWYPEGLLENTARFFLENENCQGLTCKCVDQQGQVNMAKFDLAAGFVDTHTVWTRAISFTIFLRKEVTENIGGFDEVLGVGAGTRYGSCEETDYLIRAVKRGFKIHYDPSLSVGHPRSDRFENADLFRRTSRYAPGIGYVLRKNDYSWFYFAYFVARSLGGAILSLISLNPVLAKVRWLRARGIVSGFFGRETRLAIPAAG